MGSELTYTGTVEAMDVMDQGRSTGVSFRLAGGRSVYLRLPASNRRAVDELKTAHMNDDEVTLDCKGIAPRLGAPAAEVVAVTTAQASRTGGTTAIAA